MRRGAARRYSPEKLVPAPLGHRPAGRPETAVRAAQGDGWRAFQSGPGGGRGRAEIPDTVKKGSRH